jgi:S-adenosylmethionine synthetase
VGREVIEVMGARSGGRIVLTGSCAMVGRYMANIGDCCAKRTAPVAFLAHGVRQETGPDIEVVVNAAEADASVSVYVAVTGRSAQSGDHGLVGRDNRVNRLITALSPDEPRGSRWQESRHAWGKLCNVGAHRIACAVTRETREVEDAYPTLRISPRRFRDHSHIEKHTRNFASTIHCYKP